MDCKNYSNLIEDLIEGGLDKERNEEVFMHVFACAACEAKFEALQTEKEIYSRFLFEIEPPKDLTQQFQTRLEQEFSPPTVVSGFGFGKYFADFFASRNLTPIMAAACLFPVFAFAYFAVKNSSDDSGKTVAAVETPKSNLTANTENTTVTPTSTPEIIKTIEPPKKIETVKIVKAKSFETNPKVILKEENFARKASFRENKNRSASPPPFFDERQAKLKELQAFDAEVAKQAEKVEILLRSFRNARFSEETEDYDVSYEIKQALKLLATNAKLREKAENHRAVFALETLDKVEPFLLDIANLDANPSPADVMDIKQRVRSQNVIASLQTY